MTQTSDLNNAAKTRSTRLNYRKLVLLSLVVCASINLIAFGLRSVMFSKGEIGELMLTLTISIVAPIFIGTRLISRNRKNIGWSLVIGACLTLLFWFGAFYSLATHG